MTYGERIGNEQIAHTSASIGSDYKECPINMRRVLFWFAVLLLILVDSYDPFADIFQGCFTGNRTVVWLPTTWRIWVIVVFNQNKTPQSANRIRNPCVLHVFETNDKIDKLRCNIVVTYKYMCLYWRTLESHGLIRLVCPVIGQLCEISSYVTVA